MIRALQYVAVFIGVLATYAIGIIIGAAVVTGIWAGANWLADAFHPFIASFICAISIVAVVAAIVKTDEVMRKSP